MDGGIWIENGTGLWQSYNKDTANISAVGGSQSHNNIQPYITVYMWKRIQ